MVVKKDKEQKKGDSKNFVFIVYTDSTKETLKDISGYIFKFTLKKNKDDAQIDAKIKKSVTVVDGSSGTATLSITAADFDLPIGLYFYDIEKTTPSGDVITEMEGVMNITQDITT